MDVINLAEYRLMREAIKMQNAQSLVPQSSVAVAIQAQPQVAYFPTEADWQLMLRFGASAIKSGMLPSSIKTPEAAAVIALKGRELGIPFMQAFSHIHVINGKPTMSAEMMLSLARRNLPGLVINIIKSNNIDCEIEFLRPERGSKMYKLSFTIQDAERAQLLGKAVWKQYPTAMLWSRAISAGLRKVCPEALMGISYTPEEMGAEVDKEGNVVDVPSEVSNPDPKDAQTVQNVQTVQFRGKSDAEIDQAIADSLPDATENKDGRLELAKRVSDAIQKHKVNFPDFDFRSLLKSRFNVTETKHLTLEQLAIFTNEVETIAQGKPQPVPTIKPINKPLEAAVSAVREAVQGREPGPTDKQLKRLFAIQKTAGVDDKIVKDEMYARWGISSRHELDKNMYEQICNWLENYNKPKSVEMPQNEPTWEESLAESYEHVK